jgi:hypothetical protein
MKINEGDSFRSEKTGITYEVEEVYDDAVLVSHDEQIVSPIAGMVIEVGDPVIISKNEWNLIKSNCLA